MTTASPEPITETIVLPNELQSALDAMPPAVAQTVLKPEAMRTLENLLWTYIGDPRNEAPKVIKRQDSQGHTRLYPKPPETYSDDTGRYFCIWESKPQTYHNQPDNYFTVIADQSSISELAVSRMVRGRLSAGPIFLELNLVPYGADSQPDLVPVADTSAKIYLQQRLKSAAGSVAALRLLVRQGSDPLLIGADGNEHPLVPVNILDIKSDADAFYEKFGGVLTDLAFEDYLTNTHTQAEALSDIPTINALVA